MINRHQKKESNDQAILSYYMSDYDDQRVDTGNYCKVSVFRNIYKIT